MVPLTDTQTGVWFTELAGDNRSSYHLGLRVDLHGDLDTSTLDRAVTAVVARHPVLAADVHMFEGQPYLRPGRHTIRLERMDADSSTLSKTVARLVEAPFLLYGDQPLVRFTLLRVAARHHVLVLTAHHLVFDGQSKDILLRDLARAYNEGLHGVVDYARAVRAEIEQSRRLADAARAHWSDWTPGELRVTRGGSVDVPASSDVDSAARDIGCTRFEFLLSVVHVLMHRYGNQTVPAGIDVSTRTPESADIVGMFVNELPVTTHDRPDMPFSAFAAELRAQLRRAYPLRAVPVARAAQVRLGTALCPLLVSYRRQGPVPQFAGLRSEVDWAPGGVTPRSPIHVHITDTDSGPLIRLAGTAEKVAEHLAHVLDRAMREPHTPIGMLSPAEPSSRLTGPAPEPETTLAQLLHDADRAPNQALHDAADRLAHRLAGLGIGPGKVVGLCAERGQAALIGLLGIVKAGAAYLPLDPAHPPARTRFVLEDAAPDLVLYPSDVTTGGEAAPLKEPHPGDPAYLIYTSGSTGRPKGVAVTQRAIANLLRAMRDEIGARPGHVWLWLTPLTFDISTVECFLPLLTGGTVMPVESGQSRDGAALARLVREHGVTHVQATPSSWELILAGAGDDPVWSGVTALCGGEPLTPALAERLLPRVAKLYNVYGPTETTVWSTIAEVTTAGTVTIGRPIAGTDAYVLDANMSLVPTGIDGPLCLSGVGLAGHYHGRPALTAERFLPNPFGPPGSRLYVTGDNARMDRGGSLICLGRDDLQVKIRGHRVELGEIEARLREHPAVEAAVVTLDGSGRLIAYVVGESGDLQTHLAESLPAHMIPANYVPLDSIPLTPNGKVDRAALPEPPALASEPAGDEFVEEVRAIWCEALPAASVGIDDNLFEIGGHSLTVTQIAARIRERFDVDLPLHVLWDAPTVAQTAAEIQKCL